MSKDSNEPAPAPSRVVSDPNDCDGQATRVLAALPRPGPRADQRLGERAIATDVLRDNRPPLGSSVLEHILVCRAASRRLVD